MRLKACSQPTRGTTAQFPAAQLTRLGWNPCIPPMTPGKAFQMLFGCNCLEGLWAGTLANAHYATVPARASPQIHASDFRPTPTYVPGTPYPQISQDLAWCLKIIQIWSFLCHPNH